MKQKLYNSELSSKVAPGTPTGAPATGVPGAAPLRAEGGTKLGGNC